MRESSKCYGRDLASHDELRRLYAHSEQVLGQTYLPEAVLVHSARGLWLPALCYIASDMTPASADRAYVERILAPARELGFPAWYLAHIAAFAAR